MAASQRAFRRVSDSSTGAVLRVVSYNILANKYAMSEFHDYCPMELRSWQQRLPRLCDEILDFRGDIVCLQEVEREVFTHDIGCRLRQEGFEVSSRSVVAKAQLTTCRDTVPSRGMRFDRDMIGTCPLHALTMSTL